MKLFCASLLLVSLTLSSSVSRAIERPGSADDLAGSVCRYDFSFLWFDRLAEGELSFTATETPGHFRAVLEARTLGIAAWLTSHRAHRYVSLMEVLPDGRLRTLRHETHVLKGEGEKLKDRAKEYVFNYAEGHVVYRRAKNGHFGEPQLLPMGDVPLNDFLTVFCNFRLGHYGFPAPGETLVLATFEQDRSAEIHVTSPVSTPRAHRAFFPDDGQLFQISMGDDILDTGGGKVFIWFDSLARPARGVLERVIGIGNLRGTLREEGSESL